MYRATQKRLIHQQQCAANKAQKWKKASLLCKGSLLSETKIKAPERKPGILPHVTKFPADNRTYIGKGC